ncbi:hypothetical protein CMEL01_08091 [Colletotrichum melonis]|uniref:Uncharacterized protein n=1 Tax=Colletotrichum melonis TaxID=1209925 RepID=A0AAI9U3B4_9PEZI|nr:hypothetical protein CMEL01_08091 [Colletotrichum melonis]
MGNSGSLAPTQVSILAILGIIASIRDQNDQSISDKAYPRGKACWQENTNTPAGRKNGGGGKENNVTEDSPRRGETNESGAQSLPNKTQEHRVLVPWYVTRGRNFEHNGEVDLENLGGVCRTVDRRPKNGRLSRLTGCQRRFAIFGNSVKGESGPLHLVFVNPRAQCSPCPGSRPARREGMGEDSPGDAAGGGVVPDRKCSPAATIINRVEDVWYQTARYSIRCGTSPGDCDCNAEK